MKVSSVLLLAVLLIFAVAVLSVRADYDDSLAELAADMETEELDFADVLDYDDDEYANELSFDDEEEEESLYYDEDEETLGFEKPTGGKVAPSKEKYIDRGEKSDLGKDPNAGPSKNGSPANRPQGNTNNKKTSGGQGGQKPLADKNVRPDSRPENRPSNAPNQKPNPSGGQNGGIRR